MSRLMSLIMRQARSTLRLPGALHKGIMPLEGVRRYQVHQQGPAPG